MTLLRQIGFIAIGAILVNNFVLHRFLGLCPYMGVSKRTQSALGMGLAVTFVMTMASAVTWMVYEYLLVPYQLTFLRTVAYILVIASLVQLVEMIVQKTSPSLHTALGIYLPLITTNCAVLGVAILNADRFLASEGASGRDFLFSLTQGISAGIGFTLAMLLMSGIRERLERMPVPKSLKGLPVAFIAAALMSMAFMGFTGLVPEGQ